MTLKTSIVAALSVAAVVSLLVVVALQSSRVQDSRVDDGMDAKIESLRALLGKRVQRLDKETTEEMARLMPETLRQQISAIKQRNALIKAHGMNAARKMLDDAARARLAEAQAKAAETQSKHVGKRRVTIQSVVDSATHPVDCTDPPINPNAVLDNSLDPLQHKVKYVMSMRYKPYCNFDPEGISSQNETHVWMGQAIGWNLTAPDGTGRRTCTYDVGPAQPNLVNKLKPFKPALLGVPAAIWEKHGINIPYANLPLLDEKMPLLVLSLGYGDDALEYWKFIEFLVTRLKIVIRISIYSGGDYDLEDIFVSLIQRVNDNNVIILRSLEEHVTQNSFLSGRIDVNNILVGGHSLGGTASSIVAGAGAFGFAANPVVTGIIAWDPANWKLTFADLQKLNTRFLGIYAGDDLGWQGSARANAAFDHPAKMMFWADAVVHQMFEIEACRRAGVSNETGDIVNAFGWMVPGRWPTAWCEPKPCLPLDKVPLAKAQKFSNWANWLAFTWLEAFVYGSKQAQDDLALDSIEVTQERGVFDLDWHRLDPVAGRGNDTWQGDGTSGIELNRGNQVYFPLGSSADAYDSLFGGSDAYIIADGNFKTWAKLGTDANGETTMVLIQPTKDEILKVYPSAQTF